MKNIAALERAYLILIGVGIVGTVFSQIFNIEPGPIKPVTSILIITIATLLIWHHLCQFHPVHKIAITLGAVFTIGTTSEVIGLFTGNPFGEYRYTNAWQPTISLGNRVEFPLLLPFAWVMIVGTVTILAKALLPKSHFLMQSIGAALMATLIDFVMEPVLTLSLEYWKWNEPTHIFCAPWENAFGWFFVSLLGSVPLTYLLRVTKKQGENSETKSCATVLIAYLSLMLVTGVFAENPITLLHSGGLIIVTVLLALVPRFQKQNVS